MLNLFTNIPGTNQPLVGTGGFVPPTNVPERQPKPADKDAKFLKELKNRGYSAEQAYKALQEVKQGRQPQMEAKPEVSETAPEETGFFADVKKAAEQRVKQGDVIQSTEQTGVEKFFQEAGQGAAFLGDVAFAGLKAATPEVVKEGLKSTGSFIAENTPESVKEAGMEAAKQGIEVYSDWKKNNPRAALNLEASVNIGSLLPIGKAGQVAGKGATAVKETAKAATVEARKSAAKQLLKSAEANVSKALAPTKAEMKMKAAKVAPEFVEKGIVGSRETILKKAEEGVDEFGKRIEAYIADGKLKGSVEKSKVSDVIDEFAASAKTKAGIVVDEEKLLLSDRMRSIVDKFGDAIPAEEAKSTLRVLGEMTARKKGFTTGADKLAAQLERDIYGVLARELAKANPELDALNKSFSFYKNLADVTRETIERTAPQSGMFRKAAATLFAGQGQGVVDTAMKYVGSKLFLDFVSSPFYETLSARVKRGLADAIYSGNEKAANGIIKAVKSGKTPILPKPLPKSTVLQKSSKKTSFTEKSYENAKLSADENKAIAESGQYRLRKDPLSGQMTWFRESKGLKSNKGLFAGVNAEAKPPEGYTGWFKGTDGKMRFEIDDSGAKVNSSVTPVKGKVALSDLLEHKELYEKYPELRNSEVVFSPAPGKTGGYFDPNTGKIYLSYDEFINPKTGKIWGAGSSGTHENVKSLLIHEIQHAIQYKEGFALGGSIKSFNKQKQAEIARDALVWAKDIQRKRAEFPKSDTIAIENMLVEDYRKMGAMDWMPSREARDLGAQPNVVSKGKGWDDLNALVKEYGLDENPSPISSKEGYTRLAGEVESRNVQSRMNLSMKERLAKSPESTEDVPRSKQILRSGSGKSFSIPTKNQTLKSKGGFTTIGGKADDLLSQEVAKFKKMDNREGIEDKNLFFRELGNVNSFVYDKAGKRIDKNPNIQAVYHASTVENISDINNNGFKAGLGKNSQGMTRGVGVWLYPKKEPAERFARSDLPGFKGKETDVTKAVITGKLMDIPEGMDITKAASNKKMISEAIKKGYIGFRGPETLFINKKGLEGIVKEDTIFVFDGSDVIHKKKIIDSFGGKADDAIKTIVQDKGDGEYVLKKGNVVADVVYYGDTISEDLPKNLKGKSEVYLSMIQRGDDTGYYKKSSEGKGLGKLLINDIKETFKNKGAEIMTLRVDNGMGWDGDVNGPLFKYYESLGFKHIGEGAMYIEL